MVRGQLYNRFFSPPHKCISVFKYVLIIVSIIGLFIYGFAYPKSEIFGRVIYRLNLPNKKVVALTFDDGPNGAYTEEVLNILEEESIRGTFFLIGKNVEVYPEIAREIAGRGHCIGNHSYSHPWLLPFKAKGALIAEISKAEEAIYNATGVRPKLFRPPHGFRTPWMVSTIHEMGYKIIMWDDMTTDYITSSKSEDIAKHIISHVRPGSIIVLHDGLNLNHGVKRTNATKALKTIIKDLKGRGYGFVSLQEIG